MPGSDFSTFTRDLFWKAIVAMCETITKTSGYNTQPFVTTHPSRARSSEEKHTVLIVMGDEVIESVGVGGCMEITLTINVYGYALSKDTNPIEEINPLIQDVRNVIAQNLGVITGAVGAGTALSFGVLETDSGILAQDGQAAFLLPVDLTYKAGPVW